jgi:hypothetical protein
MKKSSKIITFAEIAMILIGLIGCAGVGYPYGVGSSYGYRGGGYGYNVQPYYGYGGYGNGRYGYYGHRHAFGGGGLGGHHAESEGYGYNSHSYYGNGGYTNSRHDDF